MSNDIDLNSESNESTNWWNKYYESLRNYDQILDEIIEINENESEQTNNKTIVSTVQNETKSNMDFINDSQNEKPSNSISNSKLRRTIKKSIKATKKSELFLYTYYISGFISI